jgi:hypothetical protein
MESELIASHQQSAEALVNIENLDCSPCVQEYSMCPEQSMVTLCFCSFLSEANPPSSGQVQAGHENQQWIR